MGLLVIVHLADAWPWREGHLKRASDVEVGTGPEISRNTHGNKVAHLRPATALRLCLRKTLGPTAQRPGVEGNGTQTTRSERGRSMITSTGDRGAPPPQRKKRDDLHCLLRGVAYNLDDKHKGGPEGREGGKRPQTPKWVD